MDWASFFGDSDETLPTGSDQKTAGKNGFVRVPRDLAATNEDVNYDIEAIESFQLASFVLQHKKRPIQGRAEVRRQGALFRSSLGTEILTSDMGVGERDEIRREQLNELERRKEEIKSRHLEDLEALCSIHTREYLEDMRADSMGLKAACNDGDSGEVLTGGTGREINKEKEYPIISKWQNEHSALKYSMLSQLLDVAQRTEDIHKQRDEEQERLKQRFPASIEDFEGKEKDMQIIISTYLAFGTDEAKKSQIRAGRGWTTADVKALEEEYNKGGEFKTRVHAINRALSKRFLPSFIEISKPTNARTQHRHFHCTGGGQLGRMLAASASLLNVKVVILDSGEHAPAKQVIAPTSPAHAHLDGSFADPAKIRELATKVDVLTVEIEHVDATTLEEVEAIGGSLSIHPSPLTIRIIQDKYRQKVHLAAHGFPVSEYVEVGASVEDINAAVDKLGLPLMLKSRTLAYDGRGNFVLRDRAQAADAIAALGGRPLYAEKWVPFTKEIAVMVVRTVSGEVASYPVVETVHKDNICHLVFAPLRSRDPKLASRARSIAEDAIRTFSGAGVFGVEMFLMENGTIYINEIAPRPHNSGHYTIEACETSQYENHLRAILSLPLGSTELKVPSAVMLNLIGNSSSMGEIEKTTNVALTIPGASVHLYGKSECRKGRKMGHITLVAPSDSSLRSNLRPLLASLPDASDTETDLYAPLEPTPGSGFSSPNPLVGIIMGSDSDLPVMLPAARILDKFRVPYELTIVSAHRTPDRLVEYARSGATRGLRTIIAGAGGAAHLPGMVAAMTPLPVIGVPVKGSTLDGVDSLHSIVQMPRGVPVATVAINNGVNAGLLAVRILSAGMPSLINTMQKYMDDMESEVLGKVEKLKDVGWEKYEVKRS